MIFWLIVIGAVVMAITAGIVKFVQRRKQKASWQRTWEGTFEDFFAVLGFGALVTLGATFLLYCFSFGSYSNFEKVRSEEYQLAKGSEIKQIDDYEFTFVIESNGVKSEKTFTTTEFKVRGNERITVESYDRTSPITLPWVVSTTHFVTVK